MELLPLSATGDHIYGVNRVTTLRTDGFPCGESAGAGRVVLKVVPVTNGCCL